VRARIIPSAIAVLLTLAACDTLPTAPSDAASARALSPARAVSRDVTPPDNNCGGSAVSGVASTWPWAHSEKSDFFAPPPGGMALLIEQQGDALGFTNARGYQHYFCDQ
jgi:hypothetical protein